MSVEHAETHRMGNSQLVFSLFLFIISFSSSSSMNSIHKCPDEQRDALLLFKRNISSTNESHYYCGFSFNGYTRYSPIGIMGWNTSRDCCDWDGITCNNSTGDVISLDFKCGMLQGLSELDIVLSSLPKLEAIDLSYSGLSVVTRSDGHYVNPYLVELQLASCNLSVFPDFLRAMKHLQVLDLSRNYIRGYIPSWAGEIGGNNLTYLDLSDNSITSLPEFRSEGLQYLYLQSNLITGSFPPWICNMKHLKYLDISDNRISGMVPRCLQNISSSLVSLYVGSNMIQGLFPDIICNMDSLLYLDMSNNIFDGVIPECFEKIVSSLAMINLGENEFHGTIPILYEGCGLVDGLLLNENKLEGEVPSSLSKCTSLKLLDLGHNQLNGIFPRWLGDLPKLHVLILRSNNLHGTIEASPTAGFLFSSLRIFDISYNNFEGRLPEKYFESFDAIKEVDKGLRTYIVNISDLHYYSIIHPVKGLQPTMIYVDYTIIDLSSNRFNGQIPDVIGNLKSLMVLNLSNNNLNGQIPRALGFIQDMEALDLSRNQLEGEIPPSLVNLSYLEYFNLSQNHLVGRIPEGHQFSTFGEDSYLGNPGLCGPLLHKHCEDLSSTQVEAKGKEWINYMEPGLLGLGCGTLLGLVLGYRMLSTGKPKWFTAIADAGGHIPHRRRKKKKRTHTRNRI